MNAVTEPNWLAENAASEALLDLLQASVYPACDRYALLQIVRYCRAAALDPMLRPVHILPARDGGGGAAAIVPGIGAYRTIAARCGCAGIDEPEFGPEVGEQFGTHRLLYPVWCRVTVRRRLASGEIALFTAREFWGENVTWESDAAAGAAVPNEVWRRRPFGQLAKCAEAQALRRGFPEVGAQPVVEELSGGVLQLGGPVAVSTGADMAAAPVATPQPRSRRPAGTRAAAAQGNLGLDAPAAAASPGAPVASPAQGGASHPPAVASAPAQFGDDPAAAAAAPATTQPAETTRCLLPRQDAAVTAAVATACGAAPTAPEMATPAGDCGPHQSAARLPQASAAAASEGDPRVITAGERACLERRLQAKGWSIARAREAAGLPPGEALQDLTRPQVAALLGVTA